jgi:hypothetical protein
MSMGYLFCDSCELVMIWIWEKSQLPRVLLLSTGSSRFLFDAVWIMLSSNGEEVACEWLVGRRA